MTTTPLSINARLLATASPQARGAVSSTEPGVLAGTAEAIALLPDGLGRCVRFLADDGDHIAAGTVIAEVEGSAFDLNRIEDHLLGVLGFASGIATRAAELEAVAPVGLRIVSGAWKKLPASMKPVLRAGLDAAGVGHRLLAEEFVYVDKNSVALLGGISPAVRAGLSVGNGPVAVQIKDPDDAEAAVAAGCGAVMVDTGSLDDLTAAAAVLDRLGRSDVVLAFGGGVVRDDLDAIRRAGASVVDVGRWIVNAPILDLRMDVVRDAERDSAPTTRRG